LSKKPVVLFRRSLSEEGEFEACSRYFETKTSRMDIPKDTTVIGRYSVLPYYNELQEDLSKVNSKLINSYGQHKWIADIWEWASPGTLLEAYTPKTWNNWANLPVGKSFVLKGRTNSRKHMWKTHMFAKTNKDVSDVAIRLLEDPLISEQGVIIREYVPLKELAISISGMPVTNEWRTFWIVINSKAICVAEGFYWEKSFPDVKGCFESKGKQLAEEVAQKIAESGMANFFVLDVAQKMASDDWILIEVNDGQMSGICGCDENTLYENLVSAIGLHAPDCGWHQDWHACSCGTF